MEIPVESVKLVREQSGAGIMACRKALIETLVDAEKALELLGQQGRLIAQKKASRVATAGVVDTYLHTGGRIGAMVELNCETDFVARTDEFRELAHHLAMQIAAMSPLCVSTEEASEVPEEEMASACLMLQTDIRDPGKTIGDIIDETIARVGENIQVRRFARFELGEQE